MRGGSTRLSELDEGGPELLEIANGVPGEADLSGVFHDFALEDGVGEARQPRRGDGHKLGPAGPELARARSPVLGDASLVVHQGEAILVDGIRIKGHVVEAAPRDVALIADVARRYGVLVERGVDVQAAQVTDVADRAAWQAWEARKSRQSGARFCLQDGLAMRFFTHDISATVKVPHLRPCRCL